MNKTWSMSFLCGLGVGALVGMIYAPDTGERNRRKIAAKTKQAKRFVRERGAEVRDELVARVEHGRDALRRSAAEAIDAGRRIVRG